MNAKTLLSLTIAATLAMVSSSAAAPRTWTKGTGNYDDNMSHRPTASARQSYRAPRVVREAPPGAVATAPSQTRRFSYEPSIQGGPCHGANAQARLVPREPSSTAQSPSVARSTRRYSFEPETQTYSAQRRRPSWTSPNSLPKSDPRRYNF